MKALLYKELRLAMHPICYVFIILFPFMILVPSYPIAIGYIYVLSCYPILFLGANKGQQSNDLLFSTLLPVRKKDIVLARIFTVLIMQITFILLMSALVPLAILIRDSIVASGGDIDTSVGIGLDGYVSVVALAIIGFAIADLIFFPIYYKNGKSIVASTLVTILVFATYIAVFTIILPYIPGCGGYRDLLTGNIGIQFIFLAVSLIVSFAIHLLVYKVSSKRLEHVDF